MFVMGDAVRLPFPDQCFSLVLGSPPYVDARLYLEDGRDLGISRGCPEWVEWMLSVTAEAQRVCRGPVVWIAAGVTRDRNYWPACEGLMWEWFARGGHAYRPCYWHRVGIPGSGGDQWFRADVEYAMCFKRPGALPWTDNTAMGEPPKFAPGGEVSHRRSDGQRVNGLCSTKRGTDGTLKYEKTGYIPPEKANPGCLVRTNVGGGLLGSPIAHENEAPFPEALAEHFLRSLCPPGGTVLDPFSGSATTAAVAAKHGRRGLGFDLRRSQCELGARRIPAGLRPVSRFDPPKPVAPLPGQLSLFPEP